MYQLVWYKGAGKWDVPGFKHSRIKNKSHYDENKMYAGNLNEMEMFFWNCTWFKKIGMHLYWKLGCNNKPTILHNYYLTFKSKVDSFYHET